MARGERDIDDAFIPVPRSSVVGVELDGEGVLYDDANGSVHVLNDSALAVWASIDGQSSIADIARTLAEAYSAPLTAVLADAKSATRGFLEAGLLAEQHGGAPTAEVVRDEATDGPRYIRPPHS